MPKITRKEAIKITGWTRNTLNKYVRLGILHIERAEQDRPMVQRAVLYDLAEIESLPKKRRNNGTTNRKRNRKTRHL